MRRRSTFPLSMTELAAAQVNIVSRQVSSKESAAFNSIFVHTNTTWSTKMFNSVFKNIPHPYYSDVSTWKKVE